MPQVTSGKCPKDIIIDTSIFRQDPHRNRSAFKALEDLCKTGKVRLHIPRVVYDEFTTSLADSQSQRLKAVETALKDLSQLPPDLETNVLKLRKALKQQEEEIVKRPKNGFDGWCKEVNAQIYEIQDHHGRSVMKRYFRGEVPFKKQKNRDDIPDGYIYEAIKDIATTAEDIAVVCQDDNLAKACEGIGNVKIFRKLDDLITSPEFHALLTDQAFEELLPLFFTTLQEGHNEILHEAIDINIVDALAGKSVEHHSIPSDDHAARILSVDAPEQIEFNFDEAIYIGAGIVNIPFTCRVSVEAYFYIFKADYFALPRRRAKSISVSEYDNDHFYEADETMDVLARGTLAVEVDLAKLHKTTKTKEYIEQLIQDASIGIDSIDEVTLIEPEVRADEDDEEEVEDSSQRESDNTSPTED